MPSTATPPDPLTGLYPPIGGTYGAIPTLPSPTASAGRAISGNVANLGDLYGLQAGIGQGDIRTAMASVSALPNYGLIQSEIAGQVPQDVINQIQQGAAERGIATGSPGSPNANAAYLKALGLTSLDLTNLGSNALFSEVSRFSPAPFNPSSMLATPEEQQAAETGQAYLSAAPDPRLAAMQTNKAIRAGLNAGLGAAGGGGGPTWPQKPTPEVTYPSIPAVGGTGPFSATTPDQAYQNWLNFTRGLPGQSPQTPGQDESNVPFHLQTAQPGSDAWQQLQSLGISNPAGMTREDIAGILDIPVDEVDLGAPATAGQGGYYYAGSAEGGPGGTQDTGNYLEDYVTPDYFGE